MRVGDGVDISARDFDALDPCVGCPRARSSFDLPLWTARGFVAVDSPMLAPAPMPSSRAFAPMGAAKSAAGVIQPVPAKQSVLARKTIVEPIGDAALAGRWHLIDLKRAGHSPGATELNIRSERPMRLSIARAQPMQKSCLAL